MPAASSVAANWRLENPGRREIGRSRTSISAATPAADSRSEEHTSELQSLAYLVCRLLLEKKKTTRLERWRRTRGRRGPSPAYDAQARRLQGRFGTGCSRAGPRHAPGRSSSTS